MRNIFIRLTGLGDPDGTGGEYRDTGRRVALSDLIPAGEDTAVVRTVINRLADVRLVITHPSGDDVEMEVSHEALIRHWPRLREWLDEDRYALKLVADVRENARKWNESGREDSLLPRWNARLEKAVTLFQHPKFRQNQLEKDYLSSCKKMWDLEKREGSCWIPGA
jgi:hypothetical protein